MRPPPAGLNLYTSNVAWEREMASAIKKQKQDFAAIVESISDERVRYFYLMLGDALAQATASGAQKVNTSPAHIAEIVTRLNG